MTDGQTTGGGGVGTITPRFAQMSLDELREVKDTALVSWVRAENTENVTAYVDALLAKIGDGEPHTSGF